MDYCLNVPRYPQRFGPAEWPTGTLCEGEGPDAWGNRACGLACLRMIAAYFGRAVPSQYDLLHRAVARGAYTDRGILHQGLADLATHLGLGAVPVVLETADQLRHLLTSCGPVVVSISHQFPENGQRGGHLVVVSGVHQNPQSAVTFRDPSRWGSTHSEVSLRRFFSSFTGRAISFAANAESLRSGLADLPAAGHQTVYSSTTQPR